MHNKVMYVNVKLRTNFCALQLLLVLSLHKLKTSTALVDHNPLFVVVSDYAGAFVLKLPDLLFEVIERGGVLFHRLEQRTKIMKLFLLMFVY